MHSPAIAIACSHVRNIYCACAPRRTSQSVVSLDMQLTVLSLTFLDTFLIATQSTAAGRTSFKRDALTNQLLKGDHVAWISIEDPQPPIPAWPQTFTIKFYVYVEQYGNDWSSTGVLYYDWTSKVCDRVAYTIVLA